MDSRKQIVYPGKKKAHLVESTCIRNIFEVRLYELCFLSIFSLRI